MIEKRKAIRSKAIRASAEGENCALRICKVCKTKLVRHPNTHDTAWDKQKYCGPICRNHDINERHKHKKAEQARARRKREKTWQPTVHADHLLLTVRFS